MTTLAQVLARFNRTEPDLLVRDALEKASGAHRDRPELKAALEYMRPGDTLVVWRLSRLARSLKQIIETAHELEQKKQALKVLTRNIDTGTPEGRLFFHITAAFDEFQRE